MFAFASSILERLGTVSATSKRVWRFKKYRLNEPTIPTNKIATEAPAIPLMGNQDFRTFLKPTTSASRTFAMQRLQREESHSTLQASPFHLHQLQTFVHLG